MIKGQFTWTAARLAGLLLYYRKFGAKATASTQRLSAGRIYTLLRKAKELEKLKGQP